jgi:hypothetical protein
MKILGILVIVGILFPYLPIIPMDDCPEGGHMGNMRGDCGYLFRCPVLSNTNIVALSALAVIGRLIRTPALPKIENWVSPIFHPPKGGSAQPKLGGTIQQ